jgi:Protein of unknown function (DUF3052)
MAGYSDTPLPKKLGIRPGFRVYLGNEPDDVHVKLRAAMTECEVTKLPGGTLDFAMVFSSTRTELGQLFRRAMEVLSPSGMIWAAWPKKSSGVETDLDEHEVREIGLRAGLVDVKVAAITETWSGLKFVRRLKDRPKGA